MTLTPLMSTIEPDNKLKRNQWSWEEVRKHCTRQSCWVVVDGFVYDVTNWLESHPGGAVVLLQTAGFDATDVFNAYHDPGTVMKKMKCFRIGEVANYKPSELSGKFRELSGSIERSPLMRTSLRFYVMSVFWYLLLFISSIYCVISFRENILVGAVLGGIFMATFFQQVAFFGHDLGHMAVTHDREVDLAIGFLFGNILSGVSVGWWKATHNTHHVITNSIESDPDIQHLPFFAVTRDYTASVYSLYHERVLKYDWLAQRLVPLQSKLYYVIMALARFNLYVQSYILLLSPTKELRKRIKTFRIIELAGLLLFATWFVALVCYLPDSTSRIVFVLLSHGLAGILHVQITLSHFSMPVYTQPPLQKDPFVVHQLATSLDIDCPTWMDWFHGGLQFQTAHHLFPRVPRHNLRKLRMLLMEFCKQNNLKYNICGFIEANRKMIKHLASVGRECRERALWDIANMRG